MRAGRDLSGEMGAMAGEAAKSWIRVRLRRWLCGFNSRVLGREEGSTLVEFGLSAIVLFSLLLGLMIMSIALYSYHFISDAAREGSRYAMVRGSGCSSNGNSKGTQTNCPLATSAALQTYLRGLGFPGIVSGNLSVTASWSADGTTWTSTPGTNNAPGDQVKVVVSYQFPLKIPFVANRTLTMTSTSREFIAD